MINSFTVTYVVEENKHDFTLPQLSVDVLLPLINTLKMELQRRIAANTQPSFADERAAQHERHLEHCDKTGQQPQQQFIDFPLERKY